MNARIFILTLPAIAMGIFPARAGTPAYSAKDPEIATAVAPSRWKFGIGYAPLIGLRTEFTGLGKFNSPFTPKPLGGELDYNYDNGFVHIDSSGNLGGETWNWSYASDSQYDPSNGGSISFNQTNSLANGAASERDNAEAGIELFALLDMGAVNFGSFKNHGATWGVRAGLHYARLNFENHDRTSADLSIMTDQFALGGTIAPLAPYTGSFNGPGPLINDAPGRSFSTEGLAAVTGSRELDVHLTTFQLGGYIDFPVSPKVDFMIEAGVSMALAAGDYDYQSSASVTGLGTQNSSGSDSATSALMGIYVGVSGIYQIDPKWAVYVSTRYQFMEDFSLSTNGSRANLSINHAFQLSTGLVYSF